MISFIAAVLVGLVAVGGGLHANHPLGAMFLIMGASGGLGVLFAAQGQHTGRVVNHAADGELTVDQLHRSLNDAEHDLVLFHENPFTPVTGWFKARIGGRTVLVMERSHS